MILEEPFGTLVDGLFAGFIVSWLLWHAADIFSWGGAEEGTSRKRRPRSERPKK